MGRGGRLLEYPKLDDCRSIRQSCAVLIKIDSIKSEDKTSPDSTGVRTGSQRGLNGRGSGEGLSPPPSE